MSSRKKTTIVKQFIYIKNINVHKILVKFHSFILDSIRIFKKNTYVEIIKTPMNMNILLSWGITIVLDGIPLTVLPTSTIDEMRIISIFLF